MKLRAIAPGEIEQGLDRQNLNRINQRFSAINTDRLQRLRGALGDRQRPVVDALPLLFHTNHPMMPGFVARETPSRLCRFKLSKADISLGRSIARSFTPNVDITHEEEIYGIYIMGSVGTIAQSEKSDLDIWLCVKPGLSKKALELLDLKCKRISDWAMKFRLEAHFFLMDHQAFKQGHISTLDEESSGSAQRLLLLDEFYRTAIHIAGRKPLWWFVPETQENEYHSYTATLITKRFISQESVLDFGGIATIPDGEFVGAGIWQLYKAIESPYKSVLKLLLLEAYIAQHPRIQPLALDFKNSVYTGELNIDFLDSYVMIYRHIERYLRANNQTKRLELARRCFYFKVNKPLSKPPRSREKSWQRRMLEQLTQEWGWSKRQIEVLDQRAKWKAPEVAEERALLVNELNHSYHVIQAFGSETGAVRAISTEEITILGRKLQAAFERKPGKIEWINPGISEDLSETIIALTEHFDEEAKLQAWTAYARKTGPSNGGESGAIKSALSLVELVMWCYFNGVILPSTSFDIQRAPSINEFSLRKLINQLEHWLPLPLAPQGHDSFKHVASPTSVLLLLNVGKSPTPHLDEMGIQRLSNQTDALRYSGFEENLVASVDMVTRNSWNEIDTRRFDSQRALLDCLQDFLQLCLPSTHHKPPQLSVACVSSIHAATITRRVERWFTEILRCYYSGRYPSTTRYLFEMAGTYFSLQFKGPRLLVREHANENMLVDYLAEEQLSISPIMIDSRALLNHPLRAIADTISGSSGGRSWSGAIYVFFRRFDIGMETYVVDEMGVVLHRLYRGSGQHAPLKPLHHFLRAIINRQTRINQELLYDFGIFPMHFYELSKVGNQFQTQPKRVSQEMSAKAKFDVKAVAQPGSDSTMEFNFYCEDQEFLGRKFGDQLYLVVAQHIVKLRSTQGHYPVYLTDLDLSLCAKQLSENAKLSSSHYLKIKGQLEFKLNQAIGILQKA
ncbi:class I adenylate cyclase [Teredinibacter haidensis]|uniref:class I adenylate cyclase n=1 Tax=Teredinibacter haidensis TaxID=2731755 RepID=UPI000948B476|nr:class I adenylate cyclase [Teredinibacter haidensis]